MAPMTLERLLFLPGHWDRAHVRPLDARLPAAVPEHSAGRGPLLGRSMDT